MLSTLIHQSLKKVATVGAASALVLGIAGTAMAATPTPSSTADPTATATPTVDQTATPTPTATSTVDATATPTSQAKHGYFGDVTAKDSGSFTIQTPQGNSLDIQVDGQTQYRDPGVATPTIDSVTVGARVAVLAESSGSTTTALQVMVIPGHPQSQHLVLTVVSVNGNTLTGQDTNGNQVTVQMGQPVDPSLVGQTITFIGRPGTQSNQFDAHAQVNIDQIVSRLQNQIQQLKTASQSDPAKQQMLDRIQERLADNMQQHLDQLAQVRARVPQQAQAAFDAVIQATKSRYQQQLSDLGSQAAKVQARLTASVATGAVSAVDTSAGTLTVQPASGNSVTVKVTSGTQIQGGGSLSAIKVGSQVIVWYDGSSMDATVVRVMGDGAPSSTPSGTLSSNPGGGNGGASSGTPGSGHGGRP